MGDKGYVPLDPAAMGSAGLGVGNMPGRWGGGRHSIDAREGDDADRDRSDDREYGLPCLRRHGVSHDAMGGMETGDDSGGDEGCCDEQACPGRTDGGEQELADAEGQAGGDKADDNRAEPARAGAIGLCAGSHAREERKSEHCKREEEPAEEADGGDAEENADEDHGGVFRQMSDGRASTTTAHMRD